MPTITGSAPRDRNAIPSAQVMITGKANTQNTASGSRRNSRNRASVSSINGWRAPPLGRRRTAASACEGGLFISQVPSRQGDEHILERRAVGPQLRERRVVVSQFV